LDLLDDPAAAAELLVRFEVAMLDELGFGLDLERCAATGSTGNLAFVSPKSGRAVSVEAGEAWKDRLLPLPRFLQRGSGIRPDDQALDEAFALTGYFFTRHVYEPRGLKEPQSRGAFLRAAQAGRLISRQTGTQAS